MPLELQSRRAASEFESERSWRWIQEFWAERPVADKWSLLVENAYIGLVVGLLPEDNIFTRVLGRILGF